MSDRASSARLRPIEGKQSGAGFTRRGGDQNNFPALAGMSRIWAISRAHPLRISRLRIGILSSLWEEGRGTKKSSPSLPQCVQLGAPATYSTVGERTEGEKALPSSFPPLPHATNPLIPMAFSLISLCLRQRRVCAIVVYICTVHTHERTSLSQPFFATFPLPFPPYPFLFIRPLRFRHLPFRVCVFTAAPLLLTSDPTSPRLPFRKGERNPSGPLSTRSVEGERTQKVPGLSADGGGAFCHEAPGQKEEEEGGAWQ